MNDGGDGEPLIPVILCVCREQSQVLFDPLILPLCQPICLWVIGGAEVPLCLDSFDEFRGE